MQALQRVTTAYVDSEDRIRLTGECTDGTAVQLWLTRRLVERLLPLLLDWLKQDAGEGAHGAIMQEFAQSAALDALAPQPAVRVQDDSSVLVQTVNVTRGDIAVALEFKAGDVNDGGPSWSITFEPQPLRQWLSIVHDQYRKAEWPLSAWPAWITEADQPVAAGTPLH